MDVKIGWDGWKNNLRHLKIFRNNFARSPQRLPTVTKPWSKTGKKPWSKTGRILYGNFLRPRKIREMARVRPKRFFLPF